MENPELQINYEIYMDHYVLNDKFNDVGEDTKNEIKERYAFACFNYHNAREKLEYLLRFRTFGLAPDNFDATSGYMYLWYSITSDYFISIYAAYDKNHHSNGIRNFIRKIEHYSKKHKALLIPNLTNYTDEEKPCIVQMEKLRNNVFGHNSHNILQEIKSNSFDEKMAKECVANLFKILAMIHDAYFEGEIVEKHTGYIDEQFISEIGGLISIHKDVKQIS